MMLLAEGASRMNLTRLSSRDEMLVRHLADSMLFGPFLGSPMGRRIFDLGCGAGFPSLPLALIYPGNSFVACDSVLRKVRFVEETARDLGLSNLRPLHFRLEDAGRKKEYREQMDACTARACGPLVRVLEYGLPLLKIGGVLVVATTARALEEAGVLDGALSKLGGAPPRLYPYRLSGDQGASFLRLVFDKVGQTPDKFPRRPAKIVKKPLS